MKETTGQLLARANVVVQMIFQAQEFLEAVKKYLGEE
jgi:hypothetical protein